MPAPAVVEQSLRLLHTRGRLPGHGRQGTVIVLTPWADARWSACLPALLGAGHAVLCVLLDTPDADRGAMLDAQAAVLHAAGIRVYRHTAWAV
jgi:hypothetical protein